MKLSKFNCQKPVKNHKSNRDGATGPIPRPHLEYIDMAKGIVLLLIICAHTSGYRYIEFTQDMRVPLFWVCAGYTSSLTFSLRCKFRKLMRPYTIITIICMAYCILHITPLSIFGIIYSRPQIFPPGVREDSIPLFTLHNGSLWFLSSLFTAYCAYKLILLGKSLKWQAVIAILSLAIAGVSRCLPILLPWSMDTAFFVGPLMWVAGLLRRSRIIDTHTATTFVISLTVFVLSAHLTPECNFSTREFGSYYPLEFIAGLSGSIAFIIICKWLEGSFLSRIFIRLNSQALYVFGLQLVFLSILDRVIGGSIDGLPYILVQVFGSALLGWLTGVAADYISANLKKIYLRYSKRDV